MSHRNVIPLSSRVAADLAKQVAERKFAAHLRDDAQNAQLEEQGHLGRCVMRGTVVIESDLSTQPGYGQDRASRESFACTDRAALREQIRGGQ